jgi:hypothetical protein
MSMGRRPRERELWVAADALPEAPRHVSDETLNRFLGEAGFDDFVESLCRGHYADGVGRPGVPPGVYFRMLLVGDFEDIDSQRGVAWHCADSRSLQQFLGYALGEATPDHSSPGRIRVLLPPAAGPDWGLPKLLPALHGAVGAHCALQPLPGSPAGARHCSKSGVNGRQGRTAAVRWP